MCYVLLAMVFSELSAWDRRTRAEGVKVEGRKGGSDSLRTIQERSSSARKEPQRQNEPLVCFMVFHLPSASSHPNIY